jgi:hypothetical protein
MEKSSSENKTKDEWQWFKADGSEPGVIGPAKDVCPENSHSVSGAVKELLKKKDGYLSVGTDGLFKYSSSNKTPLPQNSITFSELEEYQKNIEIVLAVKKNNSDGSGDKFIYLRDDELCSILQNDFVTTLHNGEKKKITKNSIDAKDAKNLLRAVQIWLLFKKGGNVTSENRKFYDLYRDRIGISEDVPELHDWRVGDVINKKGEKEKQRIGLKAKTGAKKINHIVFSPVNPNLKDPEEYTKEMARMREANDFTKDIKDNKVLEITISDQMCLMVELAKLNGKNSLAFLVPELFLPRYGFRSKDEKNELKKMYLEAFKNALVFVAKKYEKFYFFLSNVKKEMKIVVPPLGDNGFLVPCDEKNFTNRNVFVADYENQQGEQIIIDAGMLKESRTLPEYIKDQPIFSINADAYAEAGNRYYSKDKNSAAAEEGFARKNPLLFPVTTYNSHLDLRVKCYCEVIITEKKSDIGKTITIKDFINIGINQKNAQNRANRVFKPIENNSGRNESKKLFIGLVVRSSYDKKKKTFSLTIESVEIGSPAQKWMDDCGISRGTRLNIKQNQRDQPELVENVPEMLEEGLLRSENVTFEFVRWNDMTKKDNEKDLPANFVKMKPIVHDLAEKKIISPPLANSNNDTLRRDQKSIANVINDLGAKKDKGGGQPSSLTTSSSFQ